MKCVFRTLHTHEFKRNFQYGYIYVRSFYIFISGSALVSCVVLWFKGVSVINASSGSDVVTYSKSFNATADMDGVVISCVATFDDTGYKPRPGEADNAPQDVPLWTSTTPLQVQCTQLLATRYHDIGHVTLTTPLSGTLCHRQAGTCHD